MQLDCYFITLLYVHGNHYFFSVSLQIFTNTVCLYDHANKASCIVNGLNPGVSVVRIV